MRERFDIAGDAAETFFNIVEALGRHLHRGRRTRRHRIAGGSHAIAEQFGLKIADIALQPLNLGFEFVGIAAENLRLRRFDGHHDERRRRQQQRHAECRSRTSTPIDHARLVLSE